ncbi:Outer membrane protein assembly factor BamB, contains PQQ-like beta-propeller repeat [Halopelagius inordinatus]|uniref:Outer membrane protein assembly factor BamB, contains PQQ-like beta-propeller repeat n=1 Tax=Halopelagius inordinatus TaxID=553467 RepID=A0A1I2S445_9EURY|nr:PQQ-binding-like beta-propeller repeat protein [Halopelagius inordinatus]SFG47644.1 Outer membrane protein assembly factor BamB, contains PQQ-like beta-propeller repeat [Halopelagius inordinatus]
MPSHTSRRRFLAAVGAAATASLAGCVDSADELDGDLGDGAPVPDDATTDWPLPHFDAQATSYNPNPVGPTEKPTARWNVEGGWPTGRIAVVGDTAYVPLAESLRALDTASGEERWRVGERTDTDTNYGSPQFTSPAVVDDTVYVGTADRRGLLALDAETGEERWRWVPGDRTDVRTPAVPADDGVAVGTDDGLVAVLDFETGDPIWTFEVFGEVSKLAFPFNSLYVGTTGGEVYNLYDGRGLWRRKLGGSIEALAVQGSNGVYAGTFGGGVYRLSGGAHTGRTRWRAEDGPTAHGALALADGIVVGTDLARARGLDHRTGEVRWEIAGDFGAPPAASGSVAYLGGEDGVVAANLDGGVGVGDARFGAKRWSVSVEGTPTTGVSVADGALFFATQGDKNAESRIYAME